MVIVACVNRSNVEAIQMSNVIGFSTSLTQWLELNLSAASTGWIKHLTDKREGRYRHWWDEFKRLVEGRGLSSLRGRPLLLLRSEAIRDQGQWLVSGKTDMSVEFQSCWSFTLIAERSELSRKGIPERFALCSLIMVWREANVTGLWSVDVEHLIISCGMNAKTDHLVSCGSWGTKRGGGCGVENRDGNIDLQRKELIETTGLKPEMKKTSSMCYINFIATAVAHDP